MVRKRLTVRAVAAAASGERSVTRRSLKSLAALATVAALTLAACGGGGGTSTPTDTQAPAETAAAEPDPNAVQRSLIGMHIEGVEGGAWASAPFGALRLWDNGTGWSQIETEKGVYKWDNLEGSQP